MSKETAGKGGDEPLPYLPLPPGARGPLDPPLLGAAPPGIGPRLAIAEGVLKKAAGVADEVFDAFHGPVTAVHTPATKAARELAGWDSSEALKTSLKNWEQQVKAAEGWLTRIAESLRGASHTYTGTDQGIEQQFSALRGLK
ncbi:MULTISPECIES: hypothetical protein [unclassified Streptomyces]|uniref:hypothetical protein n=1 Tax=unclassified Streptomyces TaxID=2593676 RepID=UPI0036562BE2